MKVSYKSSLAGIALATLSACGGGGGGGSSSSEPDRVVEPSPEPEATVVGLFTDSPVSGLRFTQGSVTGNTENGEFKYNPERNDPVCFYFGSVLLGCAAGSEVITPFDLFAPGRPASLQAGYNISRLLISMDEDPGENIRLPSSAQQAQGMVDFMLVDGKFATDNIVTELVNSYAPDGALVSRNEVDAHIADNVAVQKAIQELQQALDESIEKVDITWDSSLTQQGVFAHIQSWPEGALAASEHVYLELGGGIGNVHLAKITYVNDNGEHTSLDVGVDGVPLRAFQDRQPYRFANMVESSFENWVVTSSYYPNQSGYLLGQAGFGSGNEARFIQPSVSDELVSLIDVIPSGSFSFDDMLRVSALTVSMINSARCAGKAQDKNCGTLMEEALVRALGDDNYKEALIDWYESTLDYDLCLPVDIGLDTQGVNCQFAPNLSQFNVVVSQGYQLLETPIAVEANPNQLEFPFFYNITASSGDYVWVYAKNCEPEPHIQSLMDGSYYVSLKIREEDCLVDPNVALSGR